MERTRYAIIALLAALVGCEDDNPIPTTEPVDTAPALCDPLQLPCGETGQLRITDPIQVVPSDALPPEVRTQDANNNLDVVHHDGRLFLVFRTAPSHYASSEVMLYVVSSSDNATWTYETEVAMRTDIREPRFLSFDGRLFLYFALLGDDPTDFEPGVAMVTERLGPGQWTEPQELLEPGFIPWRTKVVDGVPYMLGYVGGENIYDLSSEPIRVYWLTTGDGVTWEPVVPGQPVVLEGGASETDFVLLDDGSLIAIARNEAGDELGWGSKICRAEADALGDWYCVGDPRKYDSPLLFRHGQAIYLIARRNVTETGNYDLGNRSRSHAEQTLQYQLDYWQKPKRCSLWRVDPERLTVEFVFDLPSRGDTCFPGLLQVSANEYLVYNYTSPLDGSDVAWFEGQEDRTSIYWLLLELP